MTEEKEKEVPAGVRKKDMDEALEKTWPEGKELTYKTDRSCTDILCCLIFTLWIFAMIGISGYAFSTGDPKVLLTKFDSDGNICGNGTVLQDRSAQGARDFAEFGLKYFTNLPDFAATAGTGQVYSVCVKTCPKKTDVNIECMVNDDVAVCPSGPAADMASGAPVILFDTHDVMGYCIPEYDDIKEFGSQLYAQMDGSTGGAMSRYMRDIQLSWWVLLIALFLSLVVTIVYLWLLYYITKPLLYGSLIGVLLFGLLFTGFSAKQFMDAMPDTEDKNSALTLTCIAGVCTLLWCCCLCWIWRGLAIGASIMQCAGQFLSKNPSIVRGPFITFFLTVPVLVWWILTNVYLYSIGTPIYVEGDMFPTIEQNNAALGMFLFIFLGAIWLIVFFSMIQSFATASSAIQWYVYGQGSDGAEDAEQVNYTLGATTGMKYHTGTLAFAGFLIAVVTLIKGIFEYCARKAEDLEAGEESSLKSCILCCLRCCVWCVDCCVRFITDNAIIQCAIEGTNFCESA